MIEANRYKLGFFVMTGLLILTAVLFVVGLRQMFEPKINVTTLFMESVQGLEAGSPVKFNGVRVGKVKNVRLRPDAGAVRVDMEIALSSFDQSPYSPDFLFYSSRRLQDEIDKGLRVQLEFLGITGLKYIELTYCPRNELDTQYLPMPEDCLDELYIPSQKSLISGIKTSVVDLLAQAQVAVNRFNTLDFGKVNALADSSSATLQDIRDLISNESPHITELVQSGTRAAEALTVLVNNTDSQIMSLELKAKLDNLNRTVSELRSASIAVVHTKTEAVKLIGQLHETVRSLNDLIRSLDESPDILIRGRAAPKIRTLPPE